MKSEWDGKVRVNEQTIIGKTVDLLFSSVVPVFGNKYVDLLYKVCGGQRINGAKDNVISNTIGAVSILSDIDFPKEISKIGKGASLLSIISFASSMIENIKNIKSTATENLTCKIFGKYMTTKSHDATASLFIMLIKKYKILLI